MKFEEIKSLITEKFEGAILGEDLESSPNALLIANENIIDICDFLFQNPNTYFDQLSCLTGIDNGPEAGTMEVVYNLYSIPRDHHLMLKVTLERKKPVIESVSSIWRTANWHEREAFDLLGIRFKNHPDLRRILLPKDWEGFPLRKDYEEQEKYHGMNVKYDRDQYPDDIPQFNQ
ncbi:MAG: NADH-quinone oxidoreductase subunit C [Bacteroidota bacterium]